jgi:hypothetical protein
MTRWKKWLGLSVGIVVLILVALYITLWFLFSRNEVASNIADFHPEYFEAKATANFFYSIDNELKYSDHIGPEAPTLIRGEVQNFLVSPDNSKIAVVVNGQLIIVSTKSILRQVTRVDSIWREPKPIGQQFFRDDDFQWSRDSKVLYLIRDEYYDSRGAQLFSRKGELWKYDTESGMLQLVLKPFPAYSYFFSLKSIFFSTPTDSGDLQLRRSDGTGVSDIGEINERDIPRKKLSKDFPESPFYSFSIIDYQKAVLPSKGVELIDNEQSALETLKIGGKSYLALTEGNGFKGHYYCSELLRSVFLPGDRYFLFNALYCGNYDGQLLIDSVTGKYQKLPKRSAVYLIVNTDTYSHYRVTGGGIVIE